MSEPFPVGNGVARRYRNGLASRIRYRGCCETREFCYILWWRSHLNSIYRGFKRGICSFVTASTVNGADDLRAQDPSDEPAAFKLAKGAVVWRLEL